MPRAGYPLLSLYLFFMEVAIRPAAGWIKETELFAPRQSTNKMLSYKARNDDVFSPFHAETD